MFISYAYKVSINVGIFVGLYDHDSPDPDKLSFKNSERLQIVDASYYNWWKARSLVTGKEGDIPSNYVTPVQSIQKQEYVVIHVT